MPSLKVTHEAQANWYRNLQNYGVRFADELVQFTAILWIKHFIKLAEQRMLPFASGILVAILPCLSFESDSRKSMLFSVFRRSLLLLMCFTDVRENAKQVNHELMKLLPKENELDGDGITE